MAIAYAVMSLVVKVGTLVYQTFIMIPAISSFFDQALINGPPAMGTIALTMKLGLYFGLGVVVVFAVYPIVLLSILLSKTGKAAFEPLPPEDEEDDDEDDENTRRDRPKRSTRDDDRFGERDDRSRRY